MNGRKWVRIFEVPLEQGRGAFREWLLVRGWTEDEIDLDLVRIDVIRGIGGDTARYSLSSELARRLGVIN